MSRIQVGDVCEVVRRVVRRHPRNKSERVYLDVGRHVRVIAAGDSYAGVPGFLVEDSDGDRWDNVLAAWLDVSEPAERQRTNLFE